MRTGGTPSLSKPFTCCMKTATCWCSTNPVDFYRSQAKEWTKSTVCRTVFSSCTPTHWSFTALTKPHPASCSWRKTPMRNETSRINLPSEWLTSATWQKSRPTSRPVMNGKPSMHRFMPTGRCAQSASFIRSDNQAKRVGACFIQAVDFLGWRFNPSRAALTKYGFT